MGGAGNFVTAPFRWRAAGAAVDCGGGFAAAGGPGRPPFARRQSIRSSSRRLRASSRDTWGIWYRTPTVSVMKAPPSAS